MNKHFIFAVALFALLGLSPLVGAKSATSKPVAASTVVKQSSKINLNTAGAKEIATTLTGIGMKKAEAIVAYRNKHGEFKSVEELAAVKGVGVATLAKNQDRIVLK